MAKKSGGGSVVLVVFLIFFILLSIGLGVSTYLGFSSDDSVAKEKDKWKKDFGVMEKERDWYAFQAQLYRAYMGHTQNVDMAKLADLRDSFDKGTLTGKDKDEVNTLVKTVLDKKLVWNAQQKRPNLSYEQLLDAETKKTEAAVAASRKFQTDLDDEKKKVTNLDDQLKQLKEDHDKAYKTLEDNAKAARDKDLKRIASLEDELKTQSTSLATRRTADDEDKLRIAKSLKEKDEVIAALRKQLGQKTTIIAEMRRELGREVPQELRPDWKVVRLDTRGETAYINLGSADKVQTQLTFRVHGLGADGRPQAKDKALLEVTSVLGEHLSQAKITYVKTPRENPRHDPVHNPVIQGDVLINPSWNPNQKKHIAIAGVVDLTGSGRDDTEQFVRALERQNVVVDAYLDLHKDFTIKGPGLTVQTDYLIIGDAPRDVLGVAQGPGLEIKEKIKTGMAELEKQAKDNGVRVRGLRQFLEEIGYRVPVSTDDRKPVIEVKGDQGGLPPAVPKEPMKKEDKAAPAPDALK